MAFSRSACVFSWRVWLIEPRFRAVLSVYLGLSLHKRRRDSIAFWRRPEAFRRGPIIHPISYVPIFPFIPAVCFKALIASEGLLLSFLRPYSVILRLKPVKGCKSAMVPM